MDPIAAEGNTEGGGGSGKKENATHNNGATDSMNTRTADKMTTGGRTKRALTTTNIHHEEVKGPFVSSLGTGSNGCNLQESRFLHLHTNSIPISGYTAFQQIDFCVAYFDFIQYLLEVTKENQLRAQPTTICQGSISKGPFPFYEEIPLINVLNAPLIEEYCNKYYPTANTNLPLTVSP